MSSLTTSRNPRRRVGRPRDERADGAILTATLELMSEVGVTELRVDEVARRASVGKATLYRRYPSKDALITAAVRELVSEIAVPDTGSTAADIGALMRAAVEVYANPAQGGLMSGLIDAMRRDPELARAVRDGFLARRRALLRVTLERGVKRGDLSSELDYELALDVLGGPLFYRLLVTGGPIDDRLADGVTELILRGFAPRPEPPRSRSKRRSTR
jgi:AcrR family transcriptional regulator